MSNQETMIAFLNNRCLLNHKSKQIRVSYSAFQFFHTANNKFWNTQFRCSPKFPSISSKNITSAYVHYLNKKQQIKLHNVSKFKYEIEWFLGFYILDFSVLRFNWTFGRLEGKIYKKKANDWTKYRVADQAWVIVIYIPLTQIKQRVVWLWKLYTVGPVWGTFTHIR